MAGESEGREGEELPGYQLRGCERLNHLRRFAAIAETAATDAYNSAVLCGKIGP